jgi:hypothetical protein
VAPFASHFPVFWARVSTGVILHCTVIVCWTCVDGRYLVAYVTGAHSENCTWRTSPEEVQLHLDLMGRQAPGSHADTMMGEDFGGLWRGRAKATCWRDVNNLCLECVTWWYQNISAYSW